MREWKKKKKEGMVRKRRDEWKERERKKRKNEKGRQE